MKNCQDYLADLYDYIDGELSNENSVELLSHIESCPECKRVYEQIKLMKEGFEEQTEFKAPEDFTQNVMKSLPKQNIFSKLNKYLPRVVAVAAVAVICVVAFNNNFTQNMKSDNATSQMFTGKTKEAKEADTQENSVITSFSMAGAEYSPQLDDGIDLETEDYVEKAKSYMTDEQKQRIEGKKSECIVEDDKVTVNFYDDDGKILTSIEFKK